MTTYDPDDIWVGSGKLRMGLEGGSNFYIVTTNYNSTEFSITNAAGFFHQSVSSGIAADGSSREFSISDASCRRRCEKPFRHPCVRRCHEKWCHREIRPQRQRHEILRQPRKQMTWLKKGAQKTGHNNTPHHMDNDTPHHTDNDTGYHTNNRNGHNADNSNMGNKTGKNKAANNRWNRRWGSNKVASWASHTRSGTERTGRQPVRAARCMDSSAAQRVARARVLP